MKPHPFFMFFCFLVLELERPRPQKRIMRLRLQKDSDIELRMNLEVILDKLLVLASKATKYNSTSEDVPSSLAAIFLMQVTGIYT